MLNLYNYLMNNIESNLTKIIIIKFEEINRNIELIKNKNILKNKYNLNVNEKIYLKKLWLKEKQKNHLLETINKKFPLKIIFNKTNCKFKDDILSSLWLKFGKLPENSEGLLTLLHDRNFFNKTIVRCQNSMNLWKLSIIYLPSVHNY